MADKSLDFEDYRKYSSDPNPTTNADLQDYMSNQNKIVTEVAESMLWQPSTTYAVGQCVHSTLIPAGKMAKCTQAGTTGATEPNWADSTLDGTVRWRLVNAGGSEYAAGSGISISNGVITNTGILSLSIGAGDNNGQIKINGVNVAPKNLKTVALTGNYNDLENKLAVDTVLSPTSTNPVQNKAIYAANQNLSSQITALGSVTVTGSTQTALTGFVSISYISSGGADMSGSYSVPNTVAGVGAGTYTLKNLLQQLVNKSHTHTNHTGSFCNCNCDCTCSGG